MSTWADKAKASGGGTVEGAITDYVFMDKFPFGDDDDASDSIYMRLDITPDGADEPVQRSLYLGSSTYLTITEKGKVLTHSEEDSVPRLYGDGEVFKFISSLEDAEFPATAKFPDPNESKTIDFRGMLGWRIRLINETDEEATKKFGKRKVTKGKHKGKEFNRTYNKVTKVFGPPVANGNGASSASTKGAKVVDDAEESTVNNKSADKFLLALIKGQPKEQVAKDDLPLIITRFAQKTKMESGERNALRAFIVADEFAYVDGAVEREVVAINKKGILTIPE